MKKCVKCNATKPFSEFHRAADHKDGYRNDCKNCVSAYQKNHNQAPVRRKHLNGQAKFKYARHKRELIMFIRRMYSLMYSRVNGQVAADAKYGNYVGLPICGRKEFYRFALKDWNLKYLFCDWIAHGNERRYIPTPDRIKRDKGYSTDNIQFLTFAENIKKRWEDGRWRKSPPRSSRDKVSG